MEPIVANASPLPDQLWAGLRQLAPAMMAFALGRHWIADDVAVVIGVAGGMIWPIVAGQLKTRERSQQLAVAAEAAPDSVAVVK